VRTFHSVGVKYLLELLQEIRHELNVLEEDPVTFFVSELEFVQSDDILTVTESDSVELLEDVNVVGLSKSLDFKDGVGTRGKDEVNRSDGSGVIIYRLQDLSLRQFLITLGIVLTVRKSSLNEVSESSGHPIGSEASDNKQFLERLTIKFSPVERKSIIFRSNLIVPLLELLGSILLNVGSKVLEAFKLNEFLHTEPSGIGHPVLDGVRFRNSCVHWAVK
jgi:hypothetical protein